MLKDLSYTYLICKQLRVQQAFLLKTGLALICSGSTLIIFFLCWCCVCVLWIFEATGLQHVSRVEHVRQCSKSIRHRDTTHFEVFVLINIVNTFRTSNIKSCPWYVTCYPGIQKGNPTPYEPNIWYLEFCLLNMAICGKFVHLFHIWYIFINNKWKKENLDPPFILCFLFLT